MNDQPWWYAQCAANIKILGGTMCDTNHCDASVVRKYSEAYCACQPPYPNGCTGPNPPPNCCSYSATSPVAVISEGCFCCCGCLSKNTPVAFDKDSYKPIEDFEIGDLVYVADDVSLTRWSQKEVLFSAGAGGSDNHNILIKVTFGTAAQSDYLLVSRGQLFLTPHGLKPAAGLVPGRDDLLDAAGSPKRVLSLEVGIFKNGLHHIATSLKAATSPDGHLLVAKGMVVGDWALQVSLAGPMRDALGLVKDAHALPEFGTRAYIEAYPELGATHHLAAVAGVATARPAPEEFESFGGDPTAYVPANAFAFFTPDQSWDIVSNAPLFPPASQAGKEPIAYLFKLFGAFYPYIDFFYDERAMQPNGYIFKEYGRDRVVVTGGLGRIVDLSYDGIFCVIATLVAATTAGEPFNGQDLSCLGMASYGAVAGVLPNVLPGLQSGPVTTSGIACLEKVFGYINSDHKGGGDTCMGVSCDCRIAAMNAAFRMLPLPSCAGGAPDAALEVDGATGTVGLPHGQCSVTFNLPVDPTTAAELGNYAFEPIVATVAATVSPQDPKTVLIEADLVAGTAYEVDITGVLSSNQQPLVPGKGTAAFRTA